MFFRRVQSAAPAGDLSLIVGLGNIGRQYDHTRHNVGFDVVDGLARRANVRFRKGRFKAEEADIIIDGRRILLLKPTTLMNLSGEAVVAAARYYKVPPARILVVCDDVNLPLGRLRIRAQGSDGGHNGLWSLIHRLGTQEFPRLRIGVGAKPEEMDMADYVLSRFTSAERTTIADAVERAMDAAESWVREGTEAAMNRWNAAGK
jgi:PTH1 family peptidyl-tRNA hydrolase